MLWYDRSLDRPTLLIYKHDGISGYSVDMNEISKGVGQSRGRNYIFYLFFFYKINKQLLHTAKVH